MCLLELYIKYCNKNVWRCINALVTSLWHSLNCFINFLFEIERASWFNGSFVLCWYLCWTRGVFWVHVVEKWVALQRFWIHVKRYNLTIDNMMYVHVQYHMLFFSVLKIIKFCLKHACFSHLGENDFKLDKFLSGTPETFEPFYGNTVYNLFLFFIVLVKAFWFVWRCWQFLTFNPFLLLFLQLFVLL